MRAGALEDNLRYKRTSINRANSKNVYESMQ
jgi:hypothetical protein